MHDFGGGDLRTLEALARMCGDLAARIDEAAPAPVLPCGGGTAAKLDKAHLPYVQSLHRNILDAVRMSAEGARRAAREEEEEAGWSDGGGSWALDDASEESSGGGGVTAP